MLTKFLFTISQTLLLLIILGCKDSSTDGAPCLDCPGDFRLTDSEPAWSPDGHTIAYVHGDTIDGQTGIWLIDTNGNNKRVIYVSAGAYSPTWSPDGQWIAFSDQAQIFKMKLNGDSLTQLTFGGRNFFPAWSPDGQWIAYDSNINDGSGGYNSWEMDKDGNYKMKIASGRMPDWFLTGDQIIFIGFHNEIYSAKLSDTSKVDRITSLNQSDIYATDNGYPKYSPDGTKIAFTSQPNGGETQIWIMNSDGSNLSQLTSTQGYSCDWSPTGEWIVYTDSRAVSGRLWLIRSDGSGNHQLTF